MDIHCDGNHMGWRSFGDRRKTNPMDLFIDKHSHIATFIMMVYHYLL